MQGAGAGLWGHAAGNGLEQSTKAGKETSGKEIDVVGGALASVLHLAGKPHAAVDNVQGFRGKGRGDHAPIKASQTYQPADGAPTETFDGQGGGEQGAYEEQGAEEKQGSGSGGSSNEEQETGGSGRASSVPMQRPHTAVRRALSASSSKRKQQKHNKAKGPVSHPRQTPSPQMIPLPSRGEGSASPALAEQKAPPPTLPQASAELASLLPPTYPHLHLPTPSPSFPQINLPARPLASPAPPSPPPPSNHGPFPPYPALPPSPPPGPSPPPPLPSPPNLPRPSPPPRPPRPPYPPFPPRAPLPPRPPPTPPPAPPLPPTPPSPPLPSPPQPPSPPRPPPRPPRPPFPPSPSPSECASPDCT